MKTQLRLILLVITVLFSTQLFCQNNEVLWKNIDWAFFEPNNLILVTPNPGAPQSQEESGADWWYDVINSYDENNMNDGFYASGFANWHDLSINEALAGGCYNKLPFSGAPECAYPRLSGQPNSPNIATVGKYDHAGNMVWCKTACQADEGAISITTTDDGSVFFTGHGRVTRDVNGNVIKLNPRPSNPNGDDIKALGFCDENNNKAIVGKFDREGNLQWVHQFMPGDITYSSNNDIDVLDNATYGLSITNIPGSNNVKIASWHVGNSGVTELFVFDVDEDGLLIPGKRKLHSNGSQNFNAKYISPDGNGDFFISGYQENASSSGKDAVLLKIDGDDNSLLPFSNNQWGNTTAAIRYNNSGTNNVGQDVVVTNDGNIVWALIEDCNKCLANGNNVGKGKLIIFTGSSIIFKDLQNESNLGFTNVHAYDMKIGLTATSDGNVALITTIKEGNVSYNLEPFSSIISDLANQVGISENDCKNGYNEIPGDNESFVEGENTDYWNTNAYVAKYSSIGNKIWEKTFPADDVAPENHPGDYKKQECLYSITEGDDGSLVFVGNASHNQDDYYITRINSDCEAQNQDEFHVTNGFSVTNTINQVVIDDPNYFDTNVPPVPFSGPVLFKGDLVITSGTDAVIDGITIEFAEGSKLIVQRGASLILQNGAKLTSLSFCPSKMWHGIEVWGNKNFDQTSSNQGLLIMDDATIENAVIGVSTVKRIGFDKQLDYTGGIVQAKNSNFTNNFLDVEFRPYQNFLSNGQITNNRSSIVDCDFYVDHLNAPIWAYVTENNEQHLRSHEAFIYFDGINGVNVRGNTFINDEPNAVDEYRGWGIFAWNSSFDVTTSCDDFNIGTGECDGIEAPNVFENLHYGIFVRPIANSGNILISKNEFTNNDFGIAFEGASNVADIHSNTFNIDEGGVFTAAHGGIYLSSVNGFKIENNTFNGMVQTPGANNGGIYAENTSVIGSSEIYRNEFNNLDVNIQTHQNNVNLFVDCNTFNHAPNSIDWHNTPSSLSFVSNQGACVSIDPKAPQANFFQGTYNIGSDYQLLNQGPVYNYNSYSDAGILPDANFVNGVNVQNCGLPISGNNDVCPSQIPFGGILQADDEISFNDGVIGDLGGVLDPVGVDDALFLLINDGGIADWDLRNELLDRAPYTREDVLVELVNSSIRPEWLVNQILDAHAPLSEKVLLAVINSNNNYSANTLRDVIRDASPTREPVLNALLDRLQPVPDWVFQQLLPLNSPLWDATLLKMLTKPQPVANHVVRDVLKINTPLSDEVNDQFIANGYPNWVVNQVNNSNVVVGNPNNKNFTISIREELEKEKAYYERLNIRIVDRTVRHLLREDSIQAAVDFLEGRDNTRTSCAVIPLLYRIKDMGRMQDHIDRVRADADDREAEDPDCKRCEEDRALCEYYDLLQQINLSPGGLAAITPQQLDRISFFAAQDLALSANFRNLKDYLEESESITTLWQPINFGSGQKNMVVDTEAPELTDIKEDPVLVMYPNPTDNTVTIQYTITNPMGKTNVSLYDLTGRKLKTEMMSQAQGSVQFSTLDYPNGVYLVVLSDDNGRHKTGKLVVRH